MNANLKPWSPRPMKSATSGPRPRNGREAFVGSMSKNAPGSDTIYGAPVPALKRTENGGLLYSSTGKALLDMNYQLSSMRSWSDERIAMSFREAYNENPRLAMRWLFYIYDIRNGAGERNVFKVVMQDMMRHGGDKMVASLVPLIPEFGRWDMLYSLLEVKSGRVYNAIKDLIRSQWAEDMQNYQNGKPISLMAKWLKSANSHIPETRHMGLVTAKMLELDESKYRKSLSVMRNYLEVVETRMSSDNWQSIDYEKVPSKANLLYKNAFLRHDYERRSAYLNALTKGEAKINSSVTFPYEIVHEYTKSMCFHQRIREINPALEAMWSSLPDKVGQNSRTLVVCDDSGSMLSPIGNTKVTCIEVAYSLAIYFSERCSGPYKDLVMTFSNTPRLRDISGSTLCDKLNTLYAHTEYSNTNIEKVFRLILDTAIRGHYQQNDIPENILILSDGEWDNMTCGRPNETMFETIKRDFESHGYKIPNLIFWNINGRTGTVPVRENSTFPAILVSGFSTSIFEMVLSSKLNPWEALVDILLKPRYDVVEEKAFNNVHPKNMRKPTTPPAGTTVRGRTNLSRYTSPAASAKRKDTPVKVTPKRVPKKMLKKC